jgi:hypothetical protein
MTTDMTEDEINREIDGEIEELEIEFYAEAERVNLRLEELGYYNRFRVISITADQFNQEFAEEMERANKKSAERSARLRRSRFHIVPSRGQS